MTGERECTACSHAAVMAMRPNPICSLFMGFDSNFGASLAITRGAVAAGVLEDLEGPSCAAGDLDIKGRGRGLEVIVAHLIAARDDHLLGAEVGDNGGALGPGAAALITQRRAEGRGLHHVAAIDEHQRVRGVAVFKVVEYPLVFHEP